MHPCISIVRALPLCALTLTLITCSFAEAAKVEKVKGKQVLIDGEGETLEEGAKVFVMIDGKKKGVVQITKVKNGKAIGKLTKGRAVADVPVEAAGASAGASSSGGGSKKRRRGGGGSGGGEPGLFVGALVGYGMDSQTVKDATGTSIAMSGSGFSLKGYGDLPIGTHLGLIMRGGVEQMSLKGTSGTVNKKTDIMYLTADLLLRYGFGEGSFVPFVAGGLGIHFPLSKSSDVLDVPRISSTTVGFFGGGVNYAMSDTMVLTGALEYCLFPPSNDVSTSIIAARFGLGWRW